MEYHTGYPGSEARNGRIILAVTILHPDGSADTDPARANAREWVAEVPHEALWDGSSWGLHEALRRAVIRAGNLPGPDTLTGPQSDWERLIETRLRGRPRDLYAAALTLMERQLLTRVLDHAAGNQTRAAEILGITRGSLRAKIRTLGITIGHSVRSENDQVGQTAVSDDPVDAPHG